MQHVILSHCKSKCMKEFLLKNYELAAPVLIIIALACDYAPAVLRRGRIRGVTDPGALGYRGPYIIIQFKNFYVFIIPPLHYLNLSLIETIMTKIYE